MVGSNTTVQATVTAMTGTPTGTVSFVNGSQIADPKQDPITLDANGNAVFNTRPAGGNIHADGRL